MAGVHTRIYRAVLERYIGSAPGNVDELLDSDVADFFRFADAQRRAKAELTRRSAPRLHPHGVEMWTARIECGFYEDEHGAPSGPMALEDYYRREAQGQAHWTWDPDFAERQYEQKLPAAMRRELEARAQQSL